MPAATTAGTAPPPARARLAAIVLLVVTACRAEAPRASDAVPAWLPAGPDSVLPVLPRSSPQFRAAGVHYWQGNWGYNFWSNFKAGRLDADFRQIRDLNFNTLFITVPWGVFQPEAFPPRYSDEAFGKLETFLASAGAHDLQVALRVATPEHIPSDIEGSHYEVPFLFVDDSAFGAYCDLFRETARRLEGFENLWFLFSSWEDMYGYARLGGGTLPERMASLKRMRPFADHLLTRPLAEWNARWRTQYASMEDVPFPRYGTLAYRDFLAWADDRLLQVILPRIARCVKSGSPRVQVGHEVRIDYDPIWPNGPDDSIEWYDHTRTWNLTPEHDVIAAYYNPYWGAPNQSDIIAAPTAVSHLERLLRLLAEHTDGRPIVFDQFNFKDATPRYRYNSRLDGELEIARFLHLALPLVHDHAAGYAIWSFRAYEANVLLNSSFESGLVNWAREPGAAGEPVRTSYDAGRQEWYAVLPPGASLRQAIPAIWNPGAADPDTPLTLRLMTRGDTGAQLTAIVEGPTAQGWSALAERRIEPDARGWAEFETRAGFSPTLRLTLRSTGTVPIAVDEVTLFNHVQDASVFGPRGDTLGWRVQMLGSMNAAWARGESGRRQSALTGAR